MPRKHNTMSAFVIIDTPKKHYSTLLKTRVWIVSSKFFKYWNVLTGCESEAPDCPCSVSPTIILGGGLPPNSPPSLEGQFN